MCHSFTSLGGGTDTLSSLTTLCTLTVMGWINHQRTFRISSNHVRNNQRGRSFRDVAPLPRYGILLFRASLLVWQVQCITVLRNGGGVNSAAKSFQNWHPEGRVGGVSFLLRPSWPPSILPDKPRNEPLMERDSEPTSSTFTPHVFHILLITKWGMEGL